MSDNDDIMIMNWGKMTHWLLNLGLKISRVSIPDICLFVTPVPFSADTKYTLIPDFFDTKIHKIQDFYTKTHLFTFFFDKRQKIVTPALPLVPRTNLRYANHQAPCNASNRQ